MHTEIISDKLETVFSDLYDLTRTLSIEHKNYSQKLASQNKTGLTTNKKSLALDHYKFASLLAESSTKMESILSHMSAIIIDADKNGDQDRIALCDTLLTRYGEFKKAISQLLTQSQRHLAEDTVTISRIYNLLSEFGYKLSFFESFLRDRKT